MEYRKKKQKFTRNEQKIIGEQLKAKQRSCITILVSLFYAPLNSVSGPTSGIVGEVTIVRGGRNKYRGWGGTLSQFWGEGCNKLKSRRFFSRNGVLPTSTIRKGRVPLRF